VQAYRSGSISTDIGRINPDTRQGVKMVYYAEIIENGRGPAGRRIHASKDHFEDGIPRLIIGEEQELRDLFGRQIHAIKKFEHDEEPTITVNDFVHLSGV
jgi:hypothetical protein